MPDDKDDGELGPAPIDLAELLDVELRFQKTVITESRFTQRQPWDLEQIHKLAAILVSQKEIAAYLSVPYRTFQTHLSKNPELRAAYDSGRNRFRMALRRRMFSIANSRRADAGRMCIWLSKQELGMSDKASVEVEDNRKAGMDEETVRLAMVKLMGEDPSDPNSGLVPATGTNDEEDDAKD